MLTCARTPARQRWNDPAYRKKVIRKREARPGEDENVETKEAREPDLAPPQRRLPQLHDLLQSDFVAWSPDSGGWVGTEGSTEASSADESTEEILGHVGSSGKPGSVGSGRKDAGGRVGSQTISRAVGGSRSGSIKSEGMQRKIKKLRLLHADQNEWIARRLGKDDEVPARESARGSLAWRLEKQARYKAAALKRVAKQRAQNEAAVAEVEVNAVTKDGGGARDTKGRG